jgi:hypothetical protein
VAAGYSQLCDKIMSGAVAFREMFGLLEINTVETVFGNRVEDSLDERGTVLGSDCRREVFGTAPSADREEGQGGMIVSLFDEVGNVSGSRQFKAEGGGVWSGYAGIGGFSLSN